MTDDSSSPHFDLEEFRKSNLAEISALESQLDSLTNETDAEHAFLTFVFLKFMDISNAGGCMDDFTHGNFSTLIELAAFYLYPHFGKCSDVYPDKVQKITDLIPALQKLQNFRFFGEDKELPQDLSIFGPAKLHAETVRGSAWPDQTKREILGIQGRFDNWFFNKVGLSPSRAVAILEAFEISANAKMKSVRNDLRKDLKFPSNEEEQLAFIQQMWEMMNKVSEEIPRQLPLSKDEIKITPEVSEDEWAALLSLVGFDQSIREKISQSAEIALTPLFIIGDNKATYFDQSSLFDALYEAFDSKAKSDNSFYSKKYTNHLADWLEQEAMSYLKRLFPVDCIFRNLVYPDPDVEGGETELDGLVLWGPFQIFIEVKGRQFRLHGQLENRSNLRTDLERNVYDAYRQGARAIRFVEGAQNPEFKEKGSGRIAKVTKGDNSLQFIISVSLHYLGALTSQLSVLKDIGLFREGNYPFSVCLADLDIITQFSGSPNVFVHYIKRRTEMQDTQTRLIGDELDLFGHYLDNRLHPAIFWESKTDDGKDIDLITFTGGANRFQEWKNAELGRRAEGPEIRLAVPERIVQVLDELRRRNDDHAHWLAFALLEFHPEDLEKLAFIFQQQLTVEFTPDHRPRIAYKNKYDDTVIVLIACKNIETPILHEMTLKRCLLEKYRHKSKKAIGFGINRSKPALIFDLALYLEFPWEKDENFQAIIDAEPLPLLPGAKLPGRNVPCPCGSGLKFKKCCLPKIEKGKARGRS